MVPCCANFSKRRGFVLTFFKAPVFALLWLTLVLWLGCGLSSPRAHAARMRAAEPSSDEEMNWPLKRFRMEHRFGLGVSFGGPLAIAGLEVDVNVSEALSIGAGLGTGFPYTTLMLKGRYFLLGRHASPYFGAGVAHWSSGPITGGASSLKPALLPHSLLSAPTTVSTNGFSVFLFYPCFGVQVASYSGFTFFAELEYFFSLFSFGNGAYGAAGVQWYL